MSFMEDLGLDGFLGDVKDVAKSVTDIYGTFWGADQQLQQAKYQQDLQALELELKRQNLTLAKDSATQNAELQKLYAQYQLTNAQRQLTGASLFGANGFDVGMGNINNTLAAGSRYNSIMLWLTVAGIGLAVLQYAKRR